MLSLLASILIVVDGDTIRLDGEKIRLWGVNAPEMSTTEGEKAKAYLEKYLADKDVVCYPTSVDRYGRTVAMCYVGNTDIACHMVNRGHAEDWPMFSDGYYKGCN